jgi:hypothetical protein
MTFRNRLRARTRTHNLTAGVPVRHNALTADHRALAAWTGGVGVAGETQHIDSIPGATLSRAVACGNQLVIAGHLLRGDT